MRLKRSVHAARVQRHCNLGGQAHSACAELGLDLHQVAASKRKVDGRKGLRVLRRESDSFARTPPNLLCLQGVRFRGAYATCGHAPEYL